MVSERKRNFKSQSTPVPRPRSSKVFFFFSVAAAQLAGVGAVAKSYDFVHGVRSEIVIVSI